MPSGFFTRRFDTIGEAAAPSLFLCDFVPKSVPEWKEKEVESYNFVLKTPASDEVHLVGQMIPFL